MSSRTDRSVLRAWRRITVGLALAGALAALAPSAPSSASSAAATARPPSEGSSDAQRRSDAAAEMNKYLDVDVTSSDLDVIQSPSNADLSVVVRRSDLARGLVGFDDTGEFFETATGYPTRKPGPAAENQTGEMAAAAAAPSRVVVGEGCVTLKQGSETMLRCWKKWQVKDDGSTTRNYYVLEMQGHVQGPSHWTAGIKSDNQSTAGIAWASPGFAPADDWTGSSCTSPSLSQLSAFGMTFGVNTTKCETWDMNYSTLAGDYKLTWYRPSFSYTSANRSVSFTAHVSVPQSLTGSPGPIWDLQYQINCSPSGLC